MIRPLATFLRALDAARTAGTLARTVRVLARQLDNAHLLAASEGARADRAELRVAELEAQTRDWAELSGELAREQPTADPLPSVLDAGEAPIPLVLTDSAREADIQRDRADALQRALQACEVDLTTQRALADSWARRAIELETERDANARAAGAHIATIERLQEQIAAAHRAAHAPAPAEQIPGVAAARTLSRLECTICPYVARELDEEAGDKCPACGSKLAEVESCDACGKPARDGERTGEAEAVLLCGRCTCKAEAEEAARATAVTEIEPPPRIASRSVRYEAVMRRSDEINAGTDDPPPTRPSERTATRTT